MAARKKAAAKKGKRKPAAHGEKHRRNTTGLASPWKPGQSGNPKGRPKRKTLTERMLEELDKPVRDKQGKPVKDDDGNVLTKYDLLVQKRVDDAIRTGALFVEVGDRIDPKPKRVELRVDPRDPDEDPEADDRTIREILARHEGAG